MKIKRLAQIVFCLWIAAMFVVWVLFHNEPLVVDACRFIGNAINNWNNGTLYPSKPDLYQDYITAIGYSNMLQLIHLIFGNIGWTQFVNMAMNIGIVLEMFYIAKRLFSATTGYIAVTLYCLMVTNLFPFIQLMTEIPYLFFALSGFTLCVKAVCGVTSEKHHSLFTVSLLVASGIIFAIAHTIRPLELAFLVPAIGFTVYMSPRLYHKAQSAWKTVCRNVVSLIIPYVIILLSIGFFYKAQTGVFITGSMTGWYDIVRSADPDIPISSSWSSVYEKGGIAYTPDWEGTTVIERNEVFRNAFFEWLKQHPFRYTAIVAVRAVKLWGADYFLMPNLTGYDDLETDEKLPEPQRQRAFVIRRVVEVGYSVVWYIAFAFFIVGLVKFIRHKGHYYQGNDNCNASAILLLSILVLGTIGTALFPVEIRYHYPYTWAMTILGSESLKNVMVSWQQKRQRKAGLQTHA